MPRNSSGTYSLPSGNPVAPNTIIETAWANPTMSDLGSALTDSLDRFGRGSMLAPIKEVDGVFNAPAYTFAAESTLGIYRPSSGVLGVAVAGLTALSISATAATFDPLVHPVWAADPVSANDLVRKSYLASQVGLYLPLTGGALAGPGNLTVGGTLGVTGVSTFTGALNATSVALAGPGNITVGGTLGVTGVSTLAAMTATTGGFSGLISSSPAEALRINNSGGYLSGYNTAGATRTGYLNFNAAGAVVLAADTGGTAGVQILAGAATRVWVDTGGLVGIGAAAPAGSKLYVSAPAGTNVLRGVNGVVDSFFGGGNGTATYGLALGTISNHDITFFINSAENARINTAGFGVGLTPTHKFDVATGAATRVYWNESGGSAFQDTVNLAASAFANRNDRALSFTFGVGAGGATALSITSAGVIQDGAARELGWKTIPQGVNTFIMGGVNMMTAGTTLGQPDVAGDVYSLYNNSAGNITLTQGSGLTLRLHGTATTGNRTLLARGWATLYYLTPTEAILMGDVT